VDSTDDLGPFPRAPDLPAGIKDASEGVGPCIRRTQGPLTCLERITVWNEALRRGRRAALEEQPPEVAQLRATRMRRCSVRKDGTATCAFGDDRLVQGLEGAVDLAFGSFHVCALLRDGAAVCKLSGPLP
jgi:hypothetical protein